MIIKENLLRSVALLTMLLPLSCRAAMLWDEGVSGDLSNDRSLPTLVTVNDGSNVLRGGFGAPDLDYVSLLVPAGFELASIVTGLNNNVGLSRAFIGVQAGTEMTVPPTTSDATGLLGWAHFSGQDGVDLLPSIGVPKAGSTGFAGPLGAGAYTFWINETSPDPGLHYDLDFRVQAAPVPAPGALGLLAAGLFGLWGLRRVGRPFNAVCRDA